MMLARLSTSVTTRGISIPTNNISNILQQCIRNNDLVVGRKVHLMIENEVLLDIKLGCPLICMFALCGSLYKSLQVFIRFRNKMCVHEVILAHAHKNQGNKAMILFN